MVKLSTIPISLSISYRSTKKNRPQFLLYIHQSRNVVVMTPHHTNFGRHERPARYSVRPGRFKEQYINDCMSLSAARSSSCNRGTQYFACGDHADSKIQFIVRGADCAIGEGSDAVFHNVISRGLNSSNIDR